MLPTLSLSISTCNHSTDPITQTGKKNNQYCHPFVCSTYPSSSSSQWSMTPNDLHASVNTPRVYFPLLIILWIQRPLVISKTSDADGKLANWDREKEKKGWEGTSSLQAHSFILRSLLSQATPALRVQKKENRVFGADACLFFFQGGGRDINLTQTATNRVYIPQLPCRLVQRGSSSKK